MTLHKFIAVVFALLSQTGFAAELDAPQHLLKAERVMNDSTASIPDVPFNRTYHELTEAQRSTFRNAYVDMPPGDEPPFPLQGLGALYGPLADIQTRLELIGKFKAEVVIGADGAVQEIRTFRSPSREATRAISRVIALVAFKPALCGGVPCKMSFPVLAAFDMNMK